MKTALFAAGIGTAIAFAAFAPNAVAQEITETFTCQGVGSGAPEPLGDREGHTITVGQYSCRVDSGPMSGSVVSGRDIWEWDGPNAVMRSNSGVTRKPGATVVYVGTGGKLALTGVFPAGMCKSKLFLGRGIRGQSSLLSFQFIVIEERQI
jgi:hypothetical protein